jgi:hypothetical protein
MLFIITASLPFVKKKFFRCHPSGDQAPKSNISLSRRRERVGVRVDLSPRGEKS